MLAAFEARTRGITAEFETRWGIDERYNDHVGAVCRALRRLLSVPAPDLAALALKIAFTVDEQAWELDGAEEILARLKADSRRLAAAYE